MKPRIKINSQSNYFQGKEDLLGTITQFLLSELLADVEERANPYKVGLRI
jgi:hypothetical protein